MAKKELDMKRELARYYYMQGEAQKAIAQKVGVSEPTISKWTKQENWEQRRAGMNITRPELVNKMLMVINNLLEQATTAASDGNYDNMAGLSDKLAKFAAVIEKLDKKANIVDAIEVFMAFGKWLQYRMSFDKEVTPELIKAINHYQDLYISEVLAKGNSN
jgi:DNA-binding XRE family transcriptional regulator